jgi:hypothetical protein
MKRQVGITVAAMILAAQLGTPATAQDATLEQLSEIATLLSMNDVTGLRAFIEANPTLLQGDSRLSELLRRFLTESGDIATLLAYDGAISSAIEELARAEALSEGGGSAGFGLEEGSDPGDSIY